MNQKPLQWNTWGRRDRLFPPKRDLFPKRCSRNNYRETVFLGTVFKLTASLPLIGDTIFSIVSADLSWFYATLLENSYDCKSYESQRWYRLNLIRRATSRQAQKPSHRVFAKFPANIEIKSISGEKLKNSR